MDNIHFLSCMFRREMSNEYQIYQYLNFLFRIIQTISIYRFYNVEILKGLVNVILYSKITKQFDDDKLFLAENENNRKLNKKFYNPDYPLLSIIPFH